MRGGRMKVKGFKNDIANDNIEKAFEDRLIIADGTMANEVNNIVSQMEEQAQLFTTKCIVQDIIDAYNGKLEWNNYLKERHELNENIKVSNNNKIFNFQKDKNEYKLEYQCELPILDYTTFYIAERLGQLERGDVKDA